MTSIISERVGHTPNWLVERTRNICHRLALISFCAKRRPLLRAAHRQRWASYVAKSKSKLLLIALVVVLAQVSSHQAHARAFAFEKSRIQQLIIGYWCYSLDDTSRCEGHEHFTPDGMVRMCAWAEDRRSHTRAVAKYSVEGDRICFDVLESSTAGLAVGLQFCATVLGINGRSYRYQVDGDRAPGAMRRLPPDATACPQQ